MDLSEFAILEGSYTEIQARNRAIAFLAGFAKRHEVISRDQWQPIVELADEVYSTEFTDDSGYIPGSMAFEKIDSLPEDLKKEVVKYFHGTNYILTAHAEDYDRERNLGLFNAPFNPNNPLYRLFGKTPGKFFVSRSEK